MRPLWKGDREYRTRLLRWKFHDNPSNDSPLGVVSVHDGRVVGFRGYMANRLALGGHGDYIGVLHPGDTCVNPDYRNRGLSVAMGNHAMNFDASRYRLFLNTSCSRNSLPGYLRLGFQPLAEKIRLVRRSHGPLGLFYNRKGQLYWPWPASAVELGRFGSIDVTDTPRPAAMAAVAAHQNAASAGFSLVQDEAFVAWRYRKPLGRYVFYMLMESDAIKAYVCVTVAANNLSAEILDHGARDDRALQEILDFILRSRHYAVLSIFSYGADAKLRQLLDERGFTITHPLQNLCRTTPGEQRALPLLIRPVQKSPTDSGFLMDGLDVRDIENWHLKPICQDGV
jgi:GNAT superfamily N-acetyltransferase